VKLREFLFFAFSLSSLILPVLHVHSTIIWGKHSGLFGDSTVKEFLIPSQKERIEDGVKMWIGYIWLMSS